MLLLSEQGIASSSPNGWYVSSIYFFITAEKQIQCYICNEMLQTIKQKVEIEKMNKVYNYNVKEKVSN